MRYFRRNGYSPWLDAGNFPLRKSHMPCSFNHDSRYRISLLQTSSVSSLYSQQMCLPEWNRYEQYAAFDSSQLPQNPILSAWKWPIRRTKPSWLGTVVRKRQRNGDRSGQHLTPKCSLPILTCITGEYHSDLIKLFTFDRIQILTYPKNQLDVQNSVWTVTFLMHLLRWNVKLNNIEFMQRRCVCKARKRAQMRENIVPKQHAPYTFQTYKLCTEIQDKKQTV